ncbi:MAG: hypothetical protein HYV34_03935 [Candidatus Kerfeldbacteria bacterium]|nr:hypothetical protein [Candidatus Kerfeldbacteria bacterium]
MPVTVSDPADTTGVKTRTVKVPVTIEVADSLLIAGEVDAGTKVTDAAIKITEAKVRVEKTQAEAKKRDEKATSEKEKVWGSEIGPKKLDEVLGTYDPATGEVDLDSSWVAADPASADDRYRFLAKRYGVPARSTGTVQERVLAMREHMFLKGRGVVTTSGVAADDGKLRKEIAAVATRTEGVATRVDSVEDRLDEYGDATTEFGRAINARTELLRAELERTQERVSALESTLEHVDLKEKVDEKRTRRARALLDRYRGRSEIRFADEDDGEPVDLEPRRD